VHALPDGLHVPWLALVPGTLLNLWPWPTTSLVIVEL